MRCAWLVLLMMLAFLLSCSATRRTEYDPGERSFPDALHAQPDDTLSSVAPGLATYCDQPGCINVYFNKTALIQLALPNNVANHSINLEERLLQRLNSATTTIDLATYEINLLDVVDALIERAASGLRVRVLADAKDVSAANPAHVERYERMRLHLERLVRGQDGILDTDDDVSVFADSPIFAVDDPVTRSQIGLPASPADLEQVTVGVGSRQRTGRLLAEGELRAVGEYFAPGPQMHNKFALVDGTWVFMGSWNFTVTGLYGTEANRLAGVLSGNQQHVVEFNSTSLSDIYRTEFDEMWGGASWAPDPANANLHGRKRDNTPHILTVGGRTVEIFFSPGDNALGRLRKGEISVLLRG